MPNSRTQSPLGVYSKDQTCVHPIAFPYHIAYREWVTIYSGVVDSGKWCFIDSLSVWTWYVFTNWRCRCRSVRQIQRTHILVINLLPVSACRTQTCAENSNVCLKSDGKCSATVPLALKVVSCFYSDLVASYSSCLVSRNPAMPFWLLLLTNKRYVKHDPILSLIENWPWQSG